MKLRNPVDLPELEDVGPGQQRLYSPLGQLAGVVLELVGQDCAALHVELLPPVDAARVLRVPLVQRLDVHVESLVVGPEGDGVVLAARHQLDVVAQVPLAVAVAHAGDVALLVVFGEGVGLVELVRGLVRALQHLLREVVVDEGGLKGQVARRVQAVALVLRRLGRSLANSQQICNAKKGIYITKRRIFKRPSTTNFKFVSV